MIPTCLLMPVRIVVDRTLEYCKGEKSGSVSYSGKLLWIKLVKNTIESGVLLI
jgi:hypothetical protein